MLDSETTDGLIMGIRERIEELESRLLTDNDNYGILEPSDDGWIEILPDTDDNKITVMTSLQKMAHELDNLSDNILFGE